MEAASPEELAVAQYITQNPVLFMSESWLAANNYSSVAVMGEDELLRTRAQCLYWDVRWVKNTLDFGPRNTAFDTGC